MAQVNEGGLDSGRDDDRRRAGAGFQFNVSAPEFVPTVQLPITGYFYPCFQFVDGTTGNSWVYVADADADQELTSPAVQSQPDESVDSEQTAPTPAPAPSPPSPPAPVQPKQKQQVQNQNQNLSKEIILFDEVKAKIIKQAEYMFSDMSLLANETLAKHVNKDPEGFVPLNFVSTLKKLKSLNISNQMVAQALRHSSKLIVSSDGKKVRRKQPFTDKEKEELQMRIVIAENLPDDHSHQKIEKMFNVVGRVKAIRICQPQEHNPSRSSKSDVVVSNKLHALVEYENTETAEKAAEKLNDERNWRKGMRVRVILKRQLKPMVKHRRSTSDISLQLEENVLVQVQPKPMVKHRRSTSDITLEDNVQLKPMGKGNHRRSSSDISLNDLDCIQPETSDADENLNSLRKSWSKNRKKPKHRQLQTACSLPTPPSHGLITSSCPGQPAKGPRMPDGTRGFTVGRGKPLSI